MADDDPRPLHIVAVSAKTQTSFKNNLLALESISMSTRIFPLAHFLLLLRLGVFHYGYRAAVTGSSLRDIREALASAANTEKFLSTAGNTTPIGFCFTGQGSQYLSMARELLAHPQFLSLVTRLEDIVLLQGFDSILDVLRGTTDAPMDQLSPVKVQLAITCLQMALGKFWMALGVSPQVLVGHSLGEYAAMNIAGVLSDADTIHLVGTRAVLLNKYCSMGTHTMLALKASADKVASLLSSQPGLEIACVNGPEETVVAGPKDQVDSFAAVLNAQSIKTTLLKVQFAFHSPQVEPMLESLDKAVALLDSRTPSFRCCRLCWAKQSKTFADLGSPADYLTRHCRGTVNFRGCLLSAAEAGVISEKTVWVEVGPHPVCTNMLKSTLGASSVKTLPTLRRGEADWKVFTSTLTSLYNSGLAINWGAVSTLYKWELKSHWIPYVHDWCLTKGDAPPQPQPLALPPPTAQQKPFTTSVQDIIHEQYSSDEAWITARSDVQHPDFREVLLAHRVNGQPVCSSAVYADMALTLFTRLLEQSAVSFDKSDIGVEVSNMTADKALVLNDDPSHLVEMKASVKWSTRQATFTMSSISSTGAENRTSRKVHRVLCGQEPVEDGFQTTRLPRKGQNRRSPTIDSRRFGVRPFDQDGHVLQAV
ncbi:hypothetical protein J3459_015265 [Metarhizium acridum]|nr:hypothetical protein J3459_015265 [Metarhizium acridum]